MAAMPCLQGRNPWPWVIAPLVLGAFGALRDLVTRRTAPR